MDIDALGVKFLSDRRDYFINKVNALFPPPLSLIDNSRCNPSRHVN